VQILLQGGIGGIKMSAQMKHTFLSLQNILNSLCVLLKGS